MGLLMRLNGGRPGGDGVADLVDALRSMLEPGQRHAVEQRRYERHKRATQEQGAPPDLDLDSGRITIRISRRDERR